VPAKTRIYVYKNICVQIYVIFMSVFSSVPAKTRCVNKRVLTCINAYSRIFTHRVSKKIATKKQSTNAGENARRRVRYLAPSNRRPDPCLYTFMQCINVYKKYRPGRDVYVKFMFLHKRVYYMYTRLSEFRQAPNILKKNDVNERDT
jgi:hypothetical protein